jgi:hypothetical protein
VELTATASRALDDGLFVISAGLIAAPQDDLWEGSVKIGHARNVSTASKYALLGKYSSIAGKLRLSYAMRCSSAKNDEGLAGNRSAIERLV